MTKDGHKNEVNGNSNGTISSQGYISPVRINEG